MHKEFCRSKSKIVSKVAGCVTICLVIAVMALISVSCKKNKGEADGSFPANFNSLPDTTQVAYMMKKVPADSLARFICNASLGKVPGAMIDSLGIATNYAYDHLAGEDLDSFSIAYDSHVESLPLPEKMKIYVLGGTENPQGLGYELGLEYMQSIRDRNMTVEDVDNEIAEFKKACGEDTDLYERFLTGFRTVLDMDNGKDVPKAIYDKYVKK